MAQHEAFALQNSGLGRFLFADVGTEPNGSALTVLSALARLGMDPWAQAARWTAQPRAAAIEGLCAAMARMPLSATALQDVPITAARLILLLPTGTALPAASGTLPSWRRWLPVALVYAVLVGGLLINMVVMPHPTPQAAAPVTHGEATLRR